MLPTDKKTGHLCRDWVKRRSNPGVAMSASLPTADMRRLHRHVGLVPHSENQTYGSMMLNDVTIVGEEVLF